MKGAPLFLKSCRSTAAELLSAWATCWACAGERVLVPAWLALANYVSPLLYVLLFFERLTEVIFHLAACLLPAFVYVLLALLTSLLSMPPEASSGAIIGDVEAGVARQEGLAQQELLRPLLRPSPTPADASAKAAHSSTWEMADFSSLKKNRRQVLTSRLYPLAAAPVASSRLAIGVSPTVAGFGRVVMLYQNGWGHRNNISTQKGRHSNSLLNGVSTRSSSMHSNSKGRTEKMQISEGAATPQGATFTPSGYGRSRYFDYWTEANFFSSGTNAEAGRGAASARTVTAEVFNTLTTETRTATQVRHGFGLWQAGLRSIAAPSATAAAATAVAATAAGSAYAEPASVAKGKAEHRSHAARTDERHIYDGEPAASTTPDSTQNVLPVTIRVSKAVRDAQRKQRILQGGDIPLTYAAINAEAPSATAGEAAGSRDRTTLVDGVAGEASEQETQNTRAQQSGHAGAHKRVDGASAITASETESAEDEENRLESEGRGGEMWLAALFMAYGYVVLSHISRGLLLELPVYSFALYLCQLLRIQGMSFSAGPSSTPPAAEEAVHRWVLFSSSVAGEEASIQESSTPPGTSNGTNHSSTASSNCGSGSSSTTTTSSTAGSSNGSSRHSHSARCVENNSCCIRRLRSDDSLRPTPSEEGVRSSTIKLVKSNRVAVLCSTKFHPCASTRTYTKWKSGDLSARVSASGAADDDPCYSPVVFMAKEAEAAGVAACTAVAQHHTDTEGARERNVKAGSPFARSFTLEEVLNRGRELAIRRARVRRYCTSVRRWNSISSAGGQDINDVQASGKPHSLRTYGRPEEEGRFWKSWDDCWLNSMSYFGLRRFTQTPSGNAAGGGCQPAGRVTTAVEAEAAGVSGGSAGAESLRQRRRSTRFDNVNTVVSRCRPTAGVPAAGEPHGRDDEAQHAAVEGPGEDHATARGGRQSLGVTTAPGTQLARGALREVGKEAATQKVWAGAARKTVGGTLREAAPQERQPRMSGDRPGVRVHAAKLKRESAALAAVRGAPNSSAVAQTSCNRKGAVLLVATAENDAVAACGSTADGEGAAASMTKGMVELLGGGRLEKNGKERQRGEQALPAAGTKGCSACVLPLMVEETEKVFAGRSHGHSSGRKVATQCRIDDSSRRVDSSNSSSVCTAAVVQRTRWNTCTAGSRALRENCCVSSTQGWKNFGLVSSVSLERGAQALLESAAYAAAQTPAVDDVATARSMRACPSSIALRSGIALVLRSSDKLQRMLRSTLRGIFWRCSYRLTAVVAARLQNIRLWLGSRGKLLRALHPFQLLSLSPIHFFPNTSQRLIFTTCCFWLLRGLHGDILFEHGTSPSPGAASACRSSVDGWAGSDAVLLEPSNAFIRSGDNKGDSDTGGVGVTNIRGGRRSSTHASGSLNLKIRDELLWREELVEPDFFPSQARSELTRDSPSFLLYAPTRRDARSASAAPRDATRVEPSASFLENHRLLVSTAYSSSSGWQRTQQKSYNLTLSSYEEYGSSHFLLVYSFLLNTFQRARVYLKPLRQWTAWLALLLLLLLMISYSLLSLSSTFEILPWQLLHVLVVLRHTRLCTYAARMVRHRKLHLPAEEHRKGVQRFFGAVDENYDEQPPQGGSQAHKAVKGDVLFTGDHQSKKEDGVDEKKVSYSRRYEEKE